MTEVVKRVELDKEEELDIEVDSEDYSRTRKIDDTTVKAGEADQVEFPDGGKGWLVIFGCSFISFSTFGMINAYGAFQSHYETELFPNVKSSTLAIIGACQPAIVYGMIPITLPLIHSFGIRNILMIGGALVITGFFGLSTTVEGQLWKCYVFQAIFYSFGAGLIYPPVFFSPVEWFKRKRAVALGISATGVGLGGMFWPLVFKNIVKKYSFKWAVRTIAIIYIPLIICAIAFIPQHLEAKYINKEETISNSKFNIEKIKKLPQKYLDTWRDWKIVSKSPIYIVLVLINLIGMFASYPAIFYIDYYAQVINPGTSLSVNLLMMYNIMGAPGRVIPGYLSDKIGRVHVLLTSLFISGLSILVLWIPSIKTKLIAPYAVFVLLFGFCIGPFFAICPACLGQIFGIVGSDARISLFYAVATPGPIIGCLIAGSFIPTHSSNEEDILNAFVKLTLYSGIMLVAASFLLIFVRFTITRKLIAFV
ncbi:hypothetical protein WICMUC_001416 [Wickerhamomyces mucosus]|uniref:Major facilitator superfamily (MFS) profile domain-containing protein n=1 Tax=Wickerhamomyces mucosus TaxID=1378264 RepID=A0A9P8PVZ8_9ASCO|nr:hypothetical protein WICMUC_001416 [Wickerhamomyces mucosus]